MHMSKWIIVWLLTCVVSTVTAFTNMMYTDAALSADSFGNQAVMDEISHHYQAREHQISYHSAVSLQQQYKTQAKWDPVSASSLAMLVTQVVCINIYSYKMRTQFGICSYLLSATI